MTGVLEYAPEDLLASHEVAAPLVAGGARCHGGFTEDGTYVSPRTLNRIPAIEAWEAHRVEEFGTDRLDVPLDTWPEHHPNVTQAKHLIRSGVPGPVIAELTRIGTVEGFGAMIRNSPVPDLQACFDEDVAGTAMAHLGRGLYEAHARDEAGYGDEGGHRQMWFAARDVAFEHPATQDETALMLERMGIPAPGPAPRSGHAGRASRVDVAALRRAAMADRALPAEISFDLEVIIARMVRLLLIEISAFHAFAWAEELLGDDELVAGEGEAARLISHVRADETPHVAYLETVLSEMRDRTLVGEDGSRHPGAEVIGDLWERALEQSLGERRAESVRIADAEVAHALEGHPRGDDILAEFHALASPPS